jgi:hypothetical protein
MFIEDSLLCLFSNESGISQGIRGQESLGSSKSILINPNFEFTRQVYLIYVPHSFIQLQFNTYYIRLIIQGHIKLFS